MTMDPNRGELSRPMRNRGVEVHLQTESGVEEMETEGTIRAAKLPYFRKFGQYDYHVKI